MSDERPARSAELLRGLRGVLARAGYDLDRVNEVTRFVRVMAPEDAAAARAASGTRSPGLTTLLALFALGAVVSPARAREALAPLEPAELVAAGLLEERGGGVGSVHAVQPFEDLMLLGDLAGEERRDQVMALSTPAVLTAWLTPRREGGSMLDLGTGSGVQALRSAGHCRRVVGVDINSRALRCAALNAELNAVANAEWRHGDWLEPVAGERFDLIVSNPPYVLSPDDEFIYRDGGPGLIARLCQALPAHLEEDGLAVLLAMWAHTGSGDWDATPRGWLADAGGDGLVIAYETTDPLDHAVTWNSPPVRRLDPGALRRTVTRWERHFERAGVGAISFGAVVLRRRTAGQRWARVVRAGAKAGPAAGRHLLRVLAHNDRPLDDEELLTARCVAPAGVGVTRTTLRTEAGWAERGAEVGMPGGLGLTANLHAAELGALLRCDGARPLSELVPAAQRGLVLPAMGELYRRGLLEVVGH